VLLFLSLLHRRRLSLANADKLAELIALRNKAKEDYGSRSNKYNNLNQKIVRLRKEVEGVASVARRRNRKRQDAEKSLDELIAMRERARKAGGFTCRRYKQLNKRISRFKQKMEGGNNTKNVAIGKANGRDTIALRLEKAERKLDELTKTQAKQANQIDNTTVVVEEIWI